jgi:hypothetical protein
LPVEQQERELGFGIEAVDDRLLVGIERVQRGVVLVEDLLVAVGEVRAGVDGGAQVVGGDEPEAGESGRMGFRRIAGEGSEAFEGADQRPSLSGAEGSKLRPEEEHPHLVTRPGGVRDDLELAFGRQRRHIGPREACLLSLHDGARFWRG